MDSVIGGHIRSTPIIKCNHSVQSGQQRNSPESLYLTTTMYIPSFIQLPLALSPLLCASLFAESCGDLNITNHFFGSTWIWFAPARFIPAPESLSWLFAPLSKHPLCQSLPTARPPTQQPPTPPCQQSFPASLFISPYYLAGCPWKMYTIPSCN